MSSDHLLISMFHFKKLFFRADELDKLIDRKKNRSGVMAA